jgi:uncharacterized membrane protein YgcG
MPMRRWFLALFATAGMTLAAAPAQAGRWGDKWDQFWHGVHVDYHRNNAWPEPFLSADRAAQREPFCIQADNGWKMQNTVGRFLFDDNEALNTAGDLHVKWIVTQAPQHRRAVFVLKGDNAEITAARVASVNAAVAKWAAGGPMPPVMVTDTEPTGVSGQYVDAIGQQYQSTVPSPRLSSGTESGSGSGGGGSGGGGSGGSSSGGSSSGGGSGSSN